jgi:hypothetical protein
MTDDGRPEPLHESDSQLHQDVVEHIETAMEISDDPEVIFHLREALQQPADRRGELDA